MSPIPEGASVSDGLPKLEEKIAKKAEPTFCRIVVVFSSVLARLIFHVLYYATTGTLEGHVV